MEATRRREEVLELLESAQGLLEKDNQADKGRPPMQIEIRTLEFWRAIIGECIGTFFYVMLLSSVHQALNHPKDSIATVQVYSALTAGLAMLTLTHAFLQVSGSHFNPAISVAAALMKKISLLRAAMYICAQCGGGIAGAAMIYGVYGRNGAKDQFGPTSIANFGMEFILSFLVGYVFFSATSRKRTSPLNTSISIGLVYMTSLTAYRGSLNPARALGPAFVADSFDFHWVFWAGPILGAVCGAFCFTFIFNMKKTKWRKTKKDVENISVKSDDDMLDDLERVRQLKTNMMTNFAEGSVYNTAVKPFKRTVSGAESVYGGTKSLYNAPCYEGRRTPGLDSRSMYGGLDEVRGGQQARGQLKRSMSVHSKIQRRNPQDNLPDEPEAGPRTGQGVAHTRQMTELVLTRQLTQTADNTANERLEIPLYNADAIYREYIRKKNTAADQSSPLEQLSGSSSGQCSGSSSGYYSSAREQQEELRREQQEQLRREQQELLRREQLRLDTELLREHKQEYMHRRDRSLGSSRAEQFRAKDRPTHPELPSGEGRAHNFTASSTSSYGY